MTKILVTSIGAPPGRNSVRALLKHGDLKIFGADAQESVLKSFSYPIEKVLTPMATDPSFLSFIADFCRKNEIEVILPCLETEVLVYSKHKSFFAQKGISLPVPEFETLQRGLDKSFLTKIAKEVGLPVPLSVSISTPKDFLLMKDLRFPVITKPKIGYGARGVIIHEKIPIDWSALERQLAEGEIIAQEYIPGGPGSIHLCAFVFDQQNKIKLSYQSKSTKTKFSFGGPAMAGVTVLDPVLQGMGKKLMAALGPWVGPVNMEFKKDERTGEFYILDLNPRIWGYSSLAEDAGLSFPFASLLVAKNRDFRSHGPYLSGVSMEREGDSDISHFSFLGGKKIHIDRFSASAPKVAALFLASDGQAHLENLAKDPSITSILVALRAGEVPYPLNYENIFYWQIPDAVSIEDLPYWTGHLFSSKEVLHREKASWEKSAFVDLRDRFWGIF